MTVIAVRALANRKFVAADLGLPNALLLANRDAINEYEHFELLVETADGWVPIDFPIGNANPPIPAMPSYSPAYVGREREWFALLVFNRPFGQQTLLDLEPTLIVNGWVLTPPNVAGERTKVHYPGGTWVRVGFGEGHWVWTVQP